MLSAFVLLFLGRLSLSHFSLPHLAAKFHVTPTPPATSAKPFVLRVCVFRAGLVHPGWLSQPHALVSDPHASTPPPPTNM